MKKVKNFVCSTICKETLDKVENEINSFTKTHNVLDIKVESANGIVIYAVIYEDEYKPRGDEDE